MRFTDFILSTKRAVMVLFTVLMVHLVALGYYTEYNRREDKQLFYTEVTQQILGLIHLTETTPHTTALNAQLAKTNFKNILFTIDVSPHSAQQITNLSPTAIFKFLYKKQLENQFSIPLNNGQWLNIKLTGNTEEELLRFLLIFLETLLTGTILWAVWAMQRFVAPLKNFKYAAERLSKDMAAEPLAEDGPPLVQQTAQALNVMQRRIRALIQDRTHMLAAISHDLRTPLTRLKLRSQFMTDVVQLEKMMNDLDEMDAMIEQILSYARDTIEHEPHVWLDLNALVNSIADDMTDVGYNVSFEGFNNRIPFKGRLLALKRAINNVIGNAIKYGHCAYIQLTQKQKMLIITIDDEGPGIPETELKAVLAPFYRMDRARSSDKGGTGLGLAIAHEVICAHQGTIELHNRVEGGLRVIITLPIEYI